MNSLIGVALFGIYANFHQVSQTASAADDDALALNLARSVCVYDAAIETLEWAQVQRQAVAGHGDGVSESVQCFDDRGRWAADLKEEMFVAAEKRFIQRATRLVYDGLRLKSVNDSPKQVLLTDYHGERRSKVGADCFFGRHVDSIGRRSLCDLLLEAKHLQIAAGSTPARPRIQGTVTLGTLIAILEVEIAPEQGCAPRCITVRDSALRTPYFRWETHSYTTVNGVSLPEAGVWMSSRLSLSGEQAEQLHAALEARQLSQNVDFADAAIQASFHDAVKRAFGADEAPSVALVPPIFVKFTYLKVNEPIDLERFNMAVPQDLEGFDEFNRKRKAPGSSEWVRTNSVPRKERGQP